MRSARILAAIGLTNLLLGGAAQAATTTITFNGLPGPNGAVFTGPYTEGGFSVSATAGQVFEGTSFGNPAPSLVVGSVFGGGPNGTVSVTDGGFQLFRSRSFDLAGNNGAVRLHGDRVRGSVPDILFLGLRERRLCGVSDSYRSRSAEVNELTFALTSNWHIAEFGQHRAWNRSGDLNLGDDAARLRWPRVRRLSSNDWRAKPQAV